MLQGKKWPKYLWAEVVNTTIYILNRSSTKAVRNRTPYEAWFEAKSKIDHFKVFDSVSHAHVPKENRDKLDGKEEKCIFIGYSDELKCFRLFNPITNHLWFLETSILTNSQHGFGRMMWLIIFRNLIWLSLCLYTKEHWKIKKLAFDPKMWMEILNFHHEKLDRWMTFIRIVTWSYYL